MGKTSLVSRFVHSLFSDKYLSTVGVKISKKNVTADGQDVSLVLWDMEGKDDYVEVNTSYLRGAMGFFVVADGTRAETLPVALELRQKALELLGPVPHYLLINKSDMVDSWEFGQETLTELEEVKNVPFYCTSAKTGLAVEEAFVRLTEEMLGKS